MTRIIEFHSTEGGDYTVVKDGETGEIISSGHEGFSPLMEDIVNHLGATAMRYEYTQEEFEEKF